MNNNLEFVVWEITDECNLNCRHCYKRFINKSDSCCIDSIMVDNIMKSLHNLKVKLLVLSGGEPLLKWDKVIEIMKKALDYRIEIVITTNGTLLNKKKVDILKAYHVNNIQISLDGSNDICHERIRGQGTYRETMKAIMLCKEAGVNTSVMTVPTADGITELEKIHDLLSGLKVDRMGVERPVAYVKDENGLFFDAEKLRCFHDVLLRIEHRGGTRIHCNDPIYQLRKMIDKGISAEGINDIAAYCRFGCTAGRSSCVIGCDGMVRVCTFVNESVGDLKKHPLEKIWNDLPELKHFQKRLPSKGKCSSCNFFQICKGCYAQILSRGKGYEDSDPACYL